MDYFVDVWQGSFQGLSEHCETMLGVLSSDERHKADCFASQRARQRYVITRGVLRQVLSRYLSLEAKALCFELGCFGKPYLAGIGLHFNLSHSDDTLLLAVCNFADIGVDLEVIKPRHHLENLVERCFSPRESAYWHALSGEERLQVFFRLWTKKEAFVKAVGRGLALGLAQCEFEPMPAGQLITIPDEYGEASAWRVRELAVSPVMSAALVTQNREYVFRQRVVAE